MREPESWEQSTGNSFRETEEEEGRGTKFQRISEESSCNGKSVDIHSPKSEASSKSNMTCVMLNAQSIRSKFNEFECYVALEKPDIGRVRCLPDDKDSSSSGPKMTFDVARTTKILRDVT